jgi:hypothetical protein
LSSSIGGGGGVGISAIPLFFGGLPLAFLHGASFSELVKWLESVEKLDVIPLLPPPDTEWSPNLILSFGVG